VFSSIFVIVTEILLITVGYMELVPYSPSKLNEHSRLYLMTDGVKCMLVKSYHSAQAEAQKCREVSRLKHWKAAGFSVPELYEFESTTLTTPHIAIEYIESISAGELIQRVLDTGGNLSNIITPILKLNAMRQRLALKNSDPELIHPDPHPYNFLMHDEGISMVDFANPTKASSIETLIVSEVERFSLSFLRIVGSRYVDEYVGWLVAAYSDDQWVLEALASMHRKCLLVRLFKRMAHQIRGKRSYRILLNASLNGQLKLC